MNNEVSGAPSYRFSGQRPSLPDPLDVCLVRLGAHVARQTGPGPSTLNLFEEMSLSCATLRHLSVAPHAAAHEHAFHCWPPSRPAWARALHPPALSDSFLPPQSWGKPS